MIGWCDDRFINLPRDFYIRYRKLSPKSVWVFMAFIENPDANDLEIANRLDMNLDDVIKSIIILEDIGLISYTKRYHLKIPRDISRETREMILCRDVVCRKCGAEKDLQIDHIIPVAKGGNSRPENLQVLCKKCNQRKSSKLEEI